LPLFADAAAGDTMATFGTGAFDAAIER
jgi:hypothetical protein